MLITVQQLQKKRQNRVLALAGFASISLISIAFLYSPLLRPVPYRLREMPIVELIPPPEIIVPPAPAEIPMPRVPVHIEVVEGPVAEQELAPTNVDFDFDPPPVARITDRPETFQSYETAPRLTYAAPVSYPEMAREAEMEGKVLVQVDLDRRGRVLRARVITSTVPALLERAALDAAMKCKFRPGFQRDIPVPTRTEIPFTFRIRR